HLFKLQAQITQLWHLNGRCPEGNIPIRRTKEEDLLRAIFAANYGRKKHHTTPNDIVQSINEYAILSEEGDRYYGMNAKINVGKPQTQAPNKSSLPQFWIRGFNSNGANLDNIEAGMMVYVISTSPLLGACKTLNY
ncbi:hypothetical protein CFP56_017124, partial [Quercus suber]